jgi:hypothetical protein
MQHGEGVCFDQTWCSPPARAAVRMCSSGLNPVRLWFQPLWYHGLGAAADAIEVAAAAAVVVPTAATVRPTISASVAMRPSRA